MPTQIHPQNIGRAKSVQILKIIETVSENHKRADMFTPILIRRGGEDHEAMSRTIFFLSGV